MIFWKWQLALLRPEEMVYLPLNFLLHQSEIDSSPNNLILAKSEIRNHSRLLLASNRRTHTHICAVPCALYFPKMNFTNRVHPTLWEDVMHTVVTLKKVQRLGCWMNSALNCEGHCFNLYCSADTSPVGGRPSLTSQVTGAAEWHSGEVGHASCHQLLSKTPCVTLASHHTLVL